MPYARQLRGVGQKPAAHQEGRIQAWAMKKLMAALLHSSGTCKKQHGLTSCHQVSSS